jgi:hypothetical protein
MENTSYFIAEFARDAPDYSFLVNALILHDASVKTYLTKINARIIRYLQYKLFNEFTPYITPSDVDVLLEKIAEVHGRSAIKITTSGSKSTIEFISPEPIVFIENKEERIKRIMQEYSNMLGDLEVTLPISRSKSNFEKDMFIMHLSKYNPIHVDAVRRLFPATALEILDAKVVAHIIQLIHCISVGEWCMYFMDGIGHYATNTDTSKLLTFDKSVIKNLQESMIL